MSQELADFLKEAIEESKKYETCMALTVHEEGDAVELILDTGVSTYGQWIKGEGADICLYRCQETDRVIGCRLPLMKRNLSVFHEGPLKINEGFRKEESDV